ncbi:MAG TPA: ABC transporter ATP-binding protein [Candidatus Dormibacteraeota bacterium]|nr:ABC transporter ATP-binding protein [Candidatus Dormibacteraeota bacterium]
MSDHAVEVEAAVKSFGALRVLDGVSLRTRRGEIYGLLGPNGSGKTTLIRSLLGMVRLDGGRVSILGQPMPDLGVLSRVGYMTQALALYPDLSVEENLRFFASLHGATGGVDDALELVALQDRRRSVVSTLSGGMQTRASLACAVVHRPDLLLLDEPTVGIDPQLRAQLWDSFHRMASRGTSILVSSHVMDEAERCDRLGLLRFGRMLAEGTAAELKARAGSDRLEDAFLRLAAGRA